MSANQKPIYTALAELYDHIMDDVDYAYWAEYVDDLMHQFHPNPRYITELSCGTASLSIELNQLGDYQLQVCDASESMVSIAEQKIKDLSLDIPSFVSAFDNLEKLHKQDVLISVFDSINYLTDEGAIRVFFKEAYKALRDGGLVIFDFSTPKNSIEAVQHLNELEGDHNGMHYYRTSHFNPHTNIHTNRFEITNKHIQSEEAIVEEHLQRAYTLPNIQSLLLDSELEIVGFFDAFSFEKATTHSTRITAIAKCLKA